jgi:DNA-binding Lrp family transcriptional regulator
MSKVEHYKKKTERENLNRLLSLLKQYGRLRSDELKEKLGVSSPTLAHYIKQLEEKERIEHIYIEGEDRRFRYYRIKPKNFENVEAQLGKYEAIRFVEKISNPLYVYRESNDKKKAIAPFISPLGQPKLDTVMKASVTQIVSYNLNSISKLLRLPNQQNMAIVIMVKGKEDVES